jgi:hypothetical protein
MAASAVVDEAVSAAAAGATAASAVGTSARVRARMLQAPNTSLAIVTFIA